MFGLEKIVCTLVVVFLGTAIGSPAQTFSSYSFDGANGTDPTAPLIQGADGNFYGTTYGGGAHNSGTVFKITPTGKLTTLYNFCSQTDCTDGTSPAGGLVQATNGNFYGTTDGGGAHGWGTVFKISSTGKLTTLYSFCSQTNCADGSNPAAGLVQGTNRNLYGTTVEGGTGDTLSECGFQGCGTVFEITPSGKLTTLYSFCSQTSCADGINPVAALVQGTNGNFYGTTDFGGNYSECPEGCGTVFEITPSGELTTLYSFCSQTNCTDGAGGEWLVQATNGNLFGTTFGGGANGNVCSNEQCGTVFEIATTGQLTTLYSFCSQTNCPDGSGPRAGLVQATNGNFYGTTFTGGTNDNADCAYGCGTIFEITPAGHLSTLYNFCSQENCTDGANPGAALMQATNGILYGTTVNAGSTCLGCGTIFSLSVGLVPFVETKPGFGKVGATVGILGNDLAGTTAVSFNGTLATTFTVASSTLIKVTVPSGATTGMIQVTTPSVTLTSNVAFQVLP